VDAPAREWTVYGAIDVEGEWPPTANATVCRVRILYRM